MIQFKNRTIPTASHSTLLVQPPDVIKRETIFFGLTGVSEIVAGRGPREITCDVWLSDPSWTNAQPTQLFAELDRLDKMVGEHGTLKEQASGGNGLTRTIKECTFLGFMPVAIEGQSAAGPLRDEARTLFSGSGAWANYVNGSGAWFIRGILRWRQTSPA